jgi:hypothetical protein
MTWQKVERFSLSCLYTLLVSGEKDNALLVSGEKAQFAQQ